MVLWGKGGKEREEGGCVPFKLCILGFVVMLLSLVCSAVWKNPNSNATKMERKIGMPKIRKLFLMVVERDWCIYLYIGRLNGERGKNISIYGTKEAVTMMDDG